MAALNPNEGGEPEESKNQHPPAQQEGWMISDP